jgi:hypothetical protein
VHAQAAVNFRLISALRHDTFLSKQKISVKITNAYYTLTISGSQLIREQVMNFLLLLHRGVRKAGPGKLRPLHR